MGTELFSRDFIITKKMEWSEKMYGLGIDFYWLTGCGCYLTRSSSYSVVSCDKERNLGVVSGGRK